MRAQVGIQGPAVYLSRNIWIRLQEVRWLFRVNGANVICFHGNLHLSFLFPERVLSRELCVASLRVWGGLSRAGAAVRVIA